MFPNPLPAAAAQAFAESDRNELHVRDVGLTAAAVLDPSSRPPTVWKSAKILDINLFHFSSGHLNKRLLREPLGSTVSP